MNATDSESVLTPQEAQRLRELEDVIAEGFESFLKVGLCFAEVRFSRLYRATHHRFEDYCGDKWGLSLSRTNQIISGVKVVQNIAQLFPEDAPVVTEIKEHELRPLAKLEPELQGAAWQLVRHIQERPRGTTIEQVVSTIQHAIESGWEERNTGSTPISSTGRNGGRHHEGRQSGQLGAFVRWARRTDTWDPEAIVAADDGLCLKRRLRAATQLKDFCEELIRAIELRLASASTL